eukprot:scaffold57294_cov32-Tisochrysis_lutea.AAC.1
MAPSFLLYAPSEPLPSTPNSDEPNAQRVPVRSMTRLNDAPDAADCTGGRPCTTMGVISISRFLLQPEPTQPCLEAPLPYSAPLVPTQRRSDWRGPGARDRVSESKLAHVIAAPRKGGAILRDCDAMRPGQMSMGREAYVSVKQLPGVPSPAHRSQYRPSCIPRRPPSELDAMTPEHASAEGTQVRSLGVSKRSLPISPPSAPAMAHRLVELAGQRGRESIVRTYAEALVAMAPICTVSSPLSSLWKPKRWGAPGGLLAAAPFESSSQLVAPETRSTGW